MNGLLEKMLEKASEKYVVGMMTYYLMYNNASDEEAKEKESYFKASFEKEMMEHYCSLVSEINF